MIRSHIDLNPLAVASFALVAFILVYYSPFWAKRRRRARVLADRHARVAEDHAWANRADDVELAGRLQFARYDLAQSLGGHSVAVSAHEEFGGIESEGWEA